MTNVIRFPRMERRAPAHERAPVTKTAFGPAPRLDGPFAVLCQTQFRDGAIARIVRAAGASCLMRSQSRGDRD